MFWFNFRIRDSSNKPRKEFIAKPRTSLDISLSENHNGGIHGARSPGESQNIWIRNQKSGSVNASRFTIYVKTGFDSKTYGNKDQNWWNVFYFSSFLRTFNICHKFSIWSKVWCYWLTVNMQHLPSISNQLNMVHHIDLREQITVMIKFNKIHLLHKNIKIKWHSIKY